MEIKIRPYQTQDAETIVAILNYYIANSTALYDYELRTLEQQQFIFEEKLKKRFPVIVATIDERVVGFGYYSEFRGERIRATCARGIEVPAHKIKRDIID